MVLDVLWSGALNHKLSSRTLCTSAMDPNQATLGSVAI